MNCLAIRKKLVEYFRKGLGKEDEAAVRHHLEHCSGCRREAGEIEHILCVSKGMRRIAPAKNSVVELNERIDAYNRGREINSYYWPAREKKSLFRPAAIGAMAILLLAVFLNYQYRPLHKYQTGNFIKEPGRAGEEKSQPFANNRPAKHLTGELPYPDIVPASPIFSSSRYSHLQALQSALRYLGDEVDYNQIVALSGEALIFKMPKSFPEENKYDIRSLVNACLCLGYKYEYSKNQNYDEMIASIKSSLKAGHPVLTAGFPKESGFICILDYDGASSQLLVKRFAGAEETVRIPVPKTDWRLSTAFESGPATNPVFVVTGREKILSQQEVMKNFFQHTVTYVAGLPEETPDFYCGDTALSKWKEALLSNDTLVAYSGTEILKESSEVLTARLSEWAQKAAGPESREILSAAAAEYNKIVLLTKEINGCIAKTDFCSVKELINAKAEEVIGAEQVALLKLNRVRERIDAYVKNRILPLLVAANYSTPARDLR